MKKTNFYLLCLLLSVTTFSLSRPSFGATASGKHFDHIITVIFENTNYDDVIRQPFFKELSLQGANLTHFLALTHPSQGNYIAMTSGSLQGVQNDRNIDLDVPNVTDLLEAKGLSWKVYAENYPGHCFTGATSGTYARKHNPFISYADIRRNPERCGKIVDASEFDTDLKNGALPNYAFYVPDIKNDGHDTGVAYANQWYQARFGTIIQDAKTMNRTVLVSTFDESGKHSQENKIYTSLLGPDVKAGDLSTTFNTLSLLKLVEENWDLGSLTAEDRSAVSIDGIWK